MTREDNQQVPRWFWILPIVGIIVVALAAGVMLKRRGGVSDELTRSPNTIPSVKVRVQMSVPAASAPATLPALVTPSAPGRAAPPRQFVLSGAAWIVRKNGSSEVLRGLQIYLVKSTIKKQSLVSVLDPKFRFEQENARMLAEDASASRSSAETLSDVQERMRAIRKAEGIEIQANTARQRAAAIEKAEGALSDPADTLECIQLARIFANLPTAQCPFLLDEAVADATHTNIEGKFSFRPHDSGQYLVWAQFESANSSVEWLCSITSEGEAVSLDLFNDNAASIDNR